MKAHMKHWSKQRKLNLKAWSYSFVFVWSHLEGTLTVVTSEARFVVHLVVSSELFHPIHFLFTCCALLGSACKWCHLKIPLGELNRGWRLSFFLVFFFSPKFCDGEICKLGHDHVQLFIGLYLRLEQKTNNNNVSCMYS